MDDIRLDLDRLATQAESRLWERLDRIVAQSSILDLGSGVLALTRHIRTVLDLAPADAVVLATLVQARVQGVCQSLMSKDRKAFDTVDVRAYCIQAGLHYFASPTDYLRSIRVDQ